MDLHIFGPGFSTLVRSVRLYCEEKALSYTYGMSLDGHSISWRCDEHRVLHPFAKVPVLLHADRHVFETSAICRYLDAVFPGRTPAHDFATQTLIEQWSSALVTSVDAALVRNYILPLIGPSRPKTLDPQALAAARLEAERTLAILDSQLGECPFICGELWSMADTLLVPMLDYLALITDPASVLGQYPRLMNYLERMRSRPSGCAVLQSAPAG
jgi:glutathione S-transferase